MGLERQRRTCKISAQLIWMYAFACVHSANGIERNRWILNMNQSLKYAPFTSTTLWNWRPNLNLSNMCLLFIFSQSYQLACIHVNWYWNALPKKKNIRLWGRLKVNNSTSVLHFKWARSSICVWLDCCRSCLQPLSLIYIRIDKCNSEMHNMSWKRFPLKNHFQWVCYCHQVTVQTV